MLAYTWNSLLFGLWFLFSLNQDHNSGYRLLVSIQDYDNVNIYMKDNLTYRQPKERTKDKSKTLTTFLIDFYSLKHFSFPYSYSANLCFQITKLNM